MTSGMNYVSRSLLGHSFLKHENSAKEEENEDRKYLSIHVCGIGPLLAQPPTFMPKERA
jgi:hypothetical protein